MVAIVRCGRCLAGGRGCLLKGPHLIPSLIKFRLPYMINAHQSINPFFLKSRGMKYCHSGKNPTYRCLWQFKLQFYHDLCYVNHFHQFGYWSAEVQMSTVFTFLREILGLLLPCSKVRSVFYIICNRPFFGIGRLCYPNRKITSLSAMCLKNTFVSLAY